MAIKISFVSKEKKEKLLMEMANQEREKIIGKR